MASTHLPGDLHMLAHEVKTDVRHIPAERTTLAYDRLQFPTLVAQMAGDDPTVRQNALQALASLCRTAQACALIPAAGGIPTLCAVLRDERAGVRTQAMEVLGVLATSPASRRALMLDQTSLQRLQRAAEDAEAAVRGGLYRLVLQLADSADAVDVLVDLRYVELLVKRAVAEEGEPELQASALRALGALLLQVDGSAVQRALDKDCMLSCAGLLTSAATPVREMAAAAVALMAVSDMGKVAALAAGALPALRDLLGDTTEVVEQALAALTNITVVDAAKGELLALSALPDVFALLSHAKRPIRVRAMNLLANLAAHPDGRSQLRDIGAVETLQTLREAARRAEEREAAEVLERLVVWEP